MHAPRRGEIIGRGRGIGRGRDQHIILQQGNAAAALGGDAADADIGAQAIAVFELQRDAGHRAQDPLDIAIGKQLQFIRADKMGRTGHAPGLLGVADNGHLFKVGRPDQRAGCKQRQQGKGQN